MVAAAKQKQEKKLTFLGHLQEIRRRLVYCVLALIITLAAAFFFSDDIIDFLVSRAPERRRSCHHADGDVRYLVQRLLLLGTGHGPAFLRVSNGAVHPAGPDPQRKSLSLPTRTGCVSLLLRRRGLCLVCLPAERS